jgi:type VI protein secretion system component VasK
VEWDLPIDGSRAVKVRYDLRAQSYKNPFRRGFFSEFRCVAQVG